MKFIKKFELYSSHIIYIILILGFISFSSLTGHWLADRSPPITKQTVEIVFDNIEQGEYALFHITATRDKACNTIIDRSLRGIDTGIVYPLPKLNITSNKIGENLELIVQVDIPSKLQPGSYIYEQDYSFYCNPIQHWLNWPIKYKTEVQPIITVVPG